ncbi:uncharacterized protein LOC123989039 [Osmia bicornis bicornis]|uniref:uncharacterized protein LOC123989039 n=1 Tax=Osmia bicornis bicornis TaxID=1437191 RepID=UPI001EAEEADF|nr:uncharacterized protein LOC123989039 [Osmia bicornis bicornis]
MPDDGLIKSVKRFDSTNFQVWKFQLTAVLLANEIFDVVDGSRTRPPDEQGANAGRMKTWIKDNVRAMAIIASAMEDEQVNSILVCGTSKEMWDKLITMHEQKSASNIGTLTQRFYSYRMNPTDSVIHHVTAVQNMARQLIDLGEKISDSAIIAKILSSLTSKYSVFKTAWDSVDPDRQTVSYLLERLIREEQSLNDEGDSVGALAVARKNNSKGNLLSKDEKDKKKKRRSKMSIECYRCQEKGHYASQCPKKKSQGDNKNSSSQTSAGCAFVIGSREKKRENAYRE